MEDRNGFTLLELLITLCLLAVLAGVSLPGLHQMLERQRADQILKELATSIQLARSYAIRNSATVTLCPSADGRECGDNWLMGYLVFNDPEENHIPASEKSILLWVRNSAHGGSLTWKAFGNRNFLQLFGLGSRLGQNGSFTYCPEDKDPTLARQLLLNSTGRTRVAVDRDGDGIREDSRGRALVC